MQKITGYLESGDKNFFFFFCFICQAKTGYLESSLPTETDINRRKSKINSAQPSEKGL